MDERMKRELLGAVKRTSARSRRTQEQAMRRISEAARERALAVQAAMDAGVPRQEIADAAGVHRVNVYKLLNALDEKN